MAKSHVFLFLDYLIFNTEVIKRRTSYKHPKICAVEQDKNKMFVKFMHI